ncbi:MAG: FAD:protein FMN transferase [Methanosarcinales archaeon]|nr:MAG: FAD:protein FMN transferase [Methanosarcinales archaeon]
MINRRHFIKGGIALVLAFLTGSRIRLWNQSPHLLESTRTMMGTSVAAMVVHDDVDSAREAMTQAFGDMHKIDSLMSIYRNDSEIATLNRNCFCENPTTDTIAVIKRAIHYSNLSGGAFAITILPIIEMWREKTGAGRHPTEDELNGALELVRPEYIALDSGAIRFKKPGMGITLGGIAKGYAVDRAIETLGQRNIKHALINAGGDIRALGGKAEGVPWKVALRNPENKEDSLTVLSLYDGAVATSGNYERCFNEEAKATHILDPRSGHPVQDLLSVTVIAESAMDADALSTTAFVLGAEKGMRLIEKLDGVEALIVTGEKEIVRSNGFHHYEV